MKNHTLKDLYIDELRDLYSAETQIIAALPKIAEAASSEELRAKINHHLEQTMQQLARLAEIFADLEEKPTGEVCEATAGLLKEGHKVINTLRTGSVRDAAIIGAAQRVEHYEMAAYGTTMAFAVLLGYVGHAKLLQATLDEETTANHALNDLAMTTINNAALEESKVLELSR